MNFQKIGDYQILEKIAEGGNGIVYKASHTENKSVVAVKTLKDNINPNSETFIRFKKEAQLLQKLNHPNILNFIDFIDEDSNLFIITEYLNGKNLKQLIENNQFTIDQKAALILQAARALDYVHSEGIIHRDIKASNIMIINNKDVKILDFGVANLINFQRLFQNKNEFVGSFAYMSPEQSGMLKRNIDHRSDLYSLGILFYQLITGVLPFVASEIGELLHLHIAKSPDEPIGLVKELSPILNKIILKLIKKDPDERYQTAFGLAEDLAVYLTLKEDQKKNFYLELGKKDKLKNLNYRSGLVGRKNELKTILSSLNNTVLQKGSATFISSKSGMGKTRLISEIQKYTGAKNACFTLISSVQGSKNQPYFPWGQAVKRIFEYFDKLSETKRNEIYQEIRDGLGLEGKILSKVIPQFSLIVGKASDKVQFSGQETELFFEKLKDFFSLASSPSRPLVLVFDDAHFWDLASIHFFKYLKNYLSRLSIYLVLSAREEELSEVSELYDAIKEDAKEGKIIILSLSPLSNDDVSDLIQEIFGHIYYGLKELSERLYESSQGNPYLMIENIKTLVEEEIIFQKNEGWSVDLEKLSLFRFPSSISDKILTRIMKISPKTKEILGCAALLGKEFEFNFLYEILKETDPKFTQENLLEALNEAIDNQLINETLSEKGAVHYSFSHDRITETLVSQMQAKKAKTIHLLAAEKLEETHKTDKNVVYQLAYHYLKAEKDKKAFLYNQKAGKQALESFSFKLAAGFYYHALGILKNEEKESEKTNLQRIKLTLEIVDLNLQISALEENIRLLEETLPLAKTMQDQQYLAQIYFLLGKNHYLLGNQVKALPYYHKAIPVAESLKMNALLALPYCAIGRSNCYTANYKESIELIQKGLSLLPAHSKDPVYELERLFSLGVLAQGLGYTGRKKEAFAVLEELKQRYQDTENDVFRLYYQFYVSSTWALCGNAEEAANECKKSIQNSKELKNKIIETYSYFFLGKSLAKLYKFDEALKNLSTMLTLSKENHIALGLFIVYFTQAESYAIAGNFEAAREAITEGEKYTGISNSDYISQWKNRLLAFFEVASPNPNLMLAKNFIDDAVITSEKMGDEYRYHYAKNIVIQSIVLWLQDKKEDSEKLYEKAIGIFQELEMDFDKNNSAKMRSHILESLSESPNLSNIKDSDKDNTYTLTFTQTEFYYQRHLKYLLKLSERLSSVHEMEGLLNKILQLAIEVSGAERSILFLFDTADNLSSPLRIKAQKAINAIEEKQEMDYSKSILDKTVRLKKGQLIMDAQKELAIDPIIQRHGMKSILTAPLMTSGKMLGVIYLDNRQVKGLFTEENFDLLKALAVQAAISIENVKLYQQVQAKARAEQELEIAKDIQTSILPFISENKDYEIAAFMQTASEVGGDYYDFFLKESPYFGVFGDVSGHGLKSGLVMMMAEVAFNALMTDQGVRSQPLPDIYQKINTTLYCNIQERLCKRSKMGAHYSNMYMTLRLFRFTHDGHFEMFGNDHAEPFICRKKTGKIETLPSSGFLLGIIEDASMGAEPVSFKLNKGDLLILYSDGITESKNQPRSHKAKRDEFGDIRLFDTIKENKDKPLPELVESVIQNVSQWMKEQEDDITLVVLKKK